MIRSILAVVAGSAVWTLLWFAANGILVKMVPEVLKTRLERVDLLLLILAYSVVYSIVAGFVTGAAARGDIMKHVLALGILQLILGITAQAASWSLMPVWFHLSFLALLIPGNLAGGKLYMARKADANT